MNPLVLPVRTRGKFANVKFRFITPTPIDLEQGRVLRRDHVMWVLRGYGGLEVHRDDFISW